MPTTILIVTAGQISRNPRVGKEAAALAAAGYSVTVISIRNVSSYDDYDRDMLRNSAFRNVALDHLSNTPIGRLRRSIDRIEVELGRRAARAGIGVPSAFGPYLALRRLVRRNPADLTIVHTELPFAIGCELIGDGQKVAADFEDWHSEDLLPAARRSRPNHLLRGYERKLMNRAAYVSTTSKSLSAALHRAYGGTEPIVVRNTFPLPALQPSTHSKGPPALFWFSQTIGAGRGLEAFVTAWSSVRTPSKLTLLGSCTDEFRQTLLRLAGHAAERLSFMPPVAPDALPNIIANFDIGLALECSTPPSRDLTITNKVFQYLNSGLLVVASSTTGQRELLLEIPETGVLVDLSHLGELTRKLEDILSSANTIAAMRMKARQAAERRFNWDHEKQALLRAVETAIGLP